MAGAKLFEHRSVIAAPPAAVMAFHEDPRALQRLTMPPVVVQLVRDDRRSLTEGVIVFTMWLGPIPVRWVAQHAPGPIATSFTDRMLEGPVARWEHHHIFEPVEGGTALIDRIALAHKPGWRGWLTRLVFDGLPLRILFTYRHWVTRRAVTRA